MQGFHKALYVEHLNRVMKPSHAQFYRYHDLESVLHDDVRALMRNPEALILIAEVFEATDTKVAFKSAKPTLKVRAVGYISAQIETDERRIPAKRGVIEDWFVSPEMRGQKVGQQLITTLEAILREAGCGLIESATWSFNDGARKAHEALGFLEYQIRYRKEL